jgi:transmembrane sensor
MIKRPKHPPGPSPQGGAENVIPLRPRSQLEAASSDWLAKIERGLTAQETAAFQKWLAEDPECEKAFFKLAELWDKMNSLSRLADLFPEPVQPQKSRQIVPIAMAATILLFAAATIWTWLVPNPRADLESEPPRVANESVFETAIGAQSIVTLPDGSVLTLNTNSLVRSDFNDARRLLRLERGEMHVQVAHDSTRPFDVQVLGKVVRAVGTAFNVEITDDQQIQLVVTQGKVLVGIVNPRRAPSAAGRYSMPDDSHVAVVAGEQAVLGADTDRITPIKPEEIEVKLSWRNGNLIFRGESLEEAIKEIERYTPVEFVFLDEDLKKVRVAGLFKAGDVEGLLTTLSTNFDIVYQRVGDRRILLSAH